MQKNLDDFIDELPAEVQETVEIDVGEYLGEPLGTTVFTFRDPSANQLFQAGLDGHKLTTMPEFFEMTETLGQSVATLALAHVSPGFASPRGISYARMAVKNPKLFMWLLNRVMDKFPHLKDLEAAIKAAKKTSSVE